MNFSKPTSTIQRKENTFEVTKKGSSIPLNTKNRMRNETQIKPKAHTPRTTPGPLSKTRKPHNCLMIEENKTPVRSDPLNNIKSYSMVELNSTPKPISKKGKSKEQGDECQILIISEIKELDVSFPLDESESALVYKSYCKLLLNAWRKRKQQMGVVENALTEYKKNLENQTVQIIVLRDMFESEKVRVAVARGDSAHMKDRLERELKTNKELKEEIELLTNEKIQLEVIQKGSEFEITRLNNELKSANEKISNLKTDLEQYKKDLTNSQTTELELLNKVGRTETHLRDKMSIIKNMTESKTNLESQIAQLVVENKSLIEANEIKQKEYVDCVEKNTKINEELDNFKNKYSTKCENFENLTRDFETVTGRFQSQNTLIENLTNELHQHQQEEKEFQDSLKAARNKIIFEAIKATVKLFFPIQNGTR